MVGMSVEFNLKNSFEVRNCQTYDHQNVDEAGFEFSAIVARDEDNRVNFDIFPPPKVLLSGFCRPYVLPVILNRIFWIRKINLRQILCE